MRSADVVSRTSSSSKVFTLRAPARAPARQPAACLLLAQLMPDDGLAASRPRPRGWAVQCPTVPRGHVGPGRAGWAVRYRGGKLERCALAAEDTAENNKVYRPGCAGLPQQQLTPRAPPLRAAPRRQPPASAPSVSCWPTRQVPPGKVRTANRCNESAAGTGVRAEPWASRPSAGRGSGGAVAECGLAWPAPDGRGVGHTLRSRVCPALAFSPTHAGRRRVPC